MRKKKDDVQRLELRGLAAHVRFVRRIGQAVRVPAAARSARLPDGYRRLDEIWWDRDEFAETEVELGPKERLERLRCLYNRELTVLKKWEVLLDSAEHLACSAELVEDLTLVDDWLAPWYVVPETDVSRDSTAGAATLRPVNVLGEDLTEAAAADQLIDRGTFPVYPDPLRHGHLPKGLRTVAIQTLCELLGRQSPVTVCVLAYDAVSPDGKTLRLVLDGNHRLAAARRIFADWRRPATDAQHPPVRVLVFAISELVKVDTRVQDADVKPGQRKFLPWWGFTPDITLLHGTAYPQMAEPAASPPGPVTAGNV
jgi:hypothetical protein